MNILESKPTVRSFFSRLLLVRSKLILTFTIILFLPSLSIGWISYNTAKNKLDDRMKQAAFENAELLNQMITQMLDAQMKNVESMAQQIEAGSIGPKPGDEDEEIRAIIDRQKQLYPELDAIGVGTEKGVMMSSPSDQQLPVDYDPRKTEWYTKAIKNRGKVVITDARIAPSTKSVVVSIAKTSDDGRGVVVVNLNLKTLDDIVNGVKIGKQGYIFISDTQKKILSHPTQKSGQALSEATAPIIYSSISGSFDFIHHRREA